MIESAGIKPIVERVAERAAESQNSVPLKEANAGDAARFQDALDGAQQTPQAEAAAAPAPMEPSAAARVESSPGDSILQSLQRMRSDYQSAVGKVQSLSQGSENMSMQDLLKAQMELSQVSMQVDLAAKVVGKATQGIETLSKSQ
ncbi:MAG: type III secretion system inner rod subunit SctI [Gammaproteobacteria bacterium]